MTSLNQVYQAALALPEQERVQLVDDLIATLKPEDAVPLDDAWLAEIERRSEEYDAGVVTGIPWSEVKERARRRLQQNG
jgi:putative addiction module component (TIGR02574 family)